MLAEPWIGWLGLRMRRDEGSGLRRGAGHDKHRMEITAVLAALQYHRESNGVGKSLKIISDSQYVVNACSSWMKKWKSKGWKKSGGLKNVDLWQQVDEAMAGLDVVFEWVRGHNGNEFIELTDQLAGSGAEWMDANVPTMKSD